ncbi:MAG: enoyl-CoA hydratase/isomerase family protein [Actinobacteria bacterium]|nr:enoyl-CoA hydratase/isomerase family protein [Actinomycetota bacterium]
MTELVHYEVAGQIATITLDNPPLNVFTLAMAPALDEALDKAEADQEVRALIVTAAGDRAFCAGSDIAEFDQLMEPGQVVPRKLGRQYEVFSRLDEFPKPTVAALVGIVYGGGIEIAVCCDILVADEEARFASPEIKLGVFPGSGGPVRVTRRVGEGRAKELMFLAEPISAAEAREWGLVNRLAAAGAAREMAREVAATLCERPPRALRYLKQAIGMSFDLEKHEALQRALVLSDRAFSSPECEEGVAAFREKRQSRFPPDPLD